MNPSTQIITIDYAKKFKAYGLPQESVFYHRLNRKTDQWDIGFQPKPNSRWTKRYDYYAAYSVEELGRLLPLGIHLPQIHRTPDGGRRWVHPSFGIITYTECEARAEVLLKLIEGCYYSKASLKFR